MEEEDAPGTGDDKNQANGDKDHSEEKEIKEEQKESKDRTIEVGTAKKKSRSKLEESMPVIVGEEEEVQEVAGEENLPEEQVKQNV